MLIVLAGCWTAPATTPPASVASTAIETCTIRARGVEPMTPVSLEVAGQVFATLDELARFEIAVGDSQLAQARVETDLVELEGELDLATFHVRPRDLHAGWLEVHHAQLRAAAGGVARLEVELPQSLVPRTVAIEVPCRELAVEERPRPEAPIDEVRTVLQRTPLLRTAGGGHLAMIEPDPEGVLIQVEVMNRLRGMLRVRITQPNAVIGWIAESATVGRQYRKYDGDDRVRGVGARAMALTCPAPVPIFVHSSTRGIVRVGTLEPDRALFIKQRAHDTLEVDLGAADLAAFVRIADVSECTR